MAMAETPEDRTKLEKLFNLYEKMMYRIAYGILNHHHDSEEYLINEESANVFVSILNEQEAIEISQEPEPAGGGAHGVIEYYNGNEVFFNVAGKLFITKYTNGESELKTYRVVDYEALNDKLCDFAKNEGALISDSD